MRLTPHSCTFPFTPVAVVRFQTIWENRCLHFFYLVKPMIKHLLCATLTSIVCAGRLLADSDQTICTRQNKSTLGKCVTQHLRGFDNVCASAAATNVNIPPDTPFLISYKPHSLSHHLGGAKVWVVPAGLLPIPFSCL